jgi:undecaprenyl-diphosphatase
MLAILHAIILGIIEGITEFLPVSSTGHIIVGEHVLGFTDPEEIFAVVIQIGAIAAVVWYFRRDLVARVRGLVRREKEAVQFWKLLAIGTIPVGVLGLLIDSYMEYIAVPLVIAITLIIGGAVLWWADHRPPRPIKHEPGTDRISIKQAWAVGLGQCLALVPGVSRAGATIVSGLFAGMDRVTATAFSFYLSIPVMVLASGYKLVQHHDAITQVSGGAAAIAVGVAVSFIVALAVVAGLLKYVSRHTFKPFAYYRIALGIGVLLWLGFFAH